jgi:hypothetical protein
MRLPPTGRQSSLNAALDLSANQPILDCPALLNLAWLPQSTHPDRPGSLIRAAVIAI